MIEKIVNAGVLKKPICVERNNFLILDGHHRFEVFKKIGLKYIPCIFFDYGDPDLKIWSLRKKEYVTKKYVIRKALDGNIYPYKTVKHLFPFKIKNINLGIEKIRHYSLYGNNDIGDYVN